MYGHYDTLSLPARGSLDDSVFPSRHELDGHRHVMSMRLNVDGGDRCLTFVHPWQLCVGNDRGDGEWSAACIMEPGGGIGP